MCMWGGGGTGLVLRVHAVHRAEGRGEETHVSTCVHVCVCVCVYGKRDDAPNAGIAGACCEEHGIIHGEESTSNSGGASIEAESVFLRFVEIEDAHNFLHAPRHDFGEIFREVACSHDMFMLEEVQFVSCERVPHARGEVRGRCECEQRRFIEFCCPYRSFMSFKGADPVSCFSISQHWFSIFARAHEEVAIIRHGTAFLTQNIYTHTHTHIYIYACVCRRVHV